MVHFKQENLWFKFYCLIENASASPHLNRHGQTQQQSQIQAGEAQNMRASQSTSCLSGPSSTQPTTTAPAGFHSKSDIEEELPNNVS